MRWHVVLASAILATSVSAQAHAGGCNVLKLPRGHVVLYARASASSSIVAQLQDPDLILLDDPDENTEWMQVTIGGNDRLNGWVKGKRVHSGQCG